MRFIARPLAPLVLFTAAALATVAPAARGADEDDDHRMIGEFSLGAGYMRFNVDGGTNILEGRDGLHLEPVLSFAPVEDVPQLRFGAAVGWSMALDDVSGAFISHDGGTFLVTSGDVTFMTFEPELRLSWRQPLGDGNFFIEPGVAAGALIGWLDVGDENDPTPSPADANDFEDTDVTFQWKVFVRAGMRVTGGIAGIEASYMMANRLEFSGNLSGDPSEVYVGIFGALQF
jgi:hypothetical protein